ncbi:uncharacterized protein LOC136040064 isoform X1 [Artemia franciscana]|uniref:uncharacterized protein LOC136040064 isoform X1 n=1 Tax=Artemia franciscana TaxID=6661 RepID=UPI0032DA08A7
MNFFALSKIRVLFKLIEIVLAIVNIGVIRDHFVLGWMPLALMYGYSPDPRYDLREKDQIYAPYVDLSFLTIFTVSGQILIILPLLVLHIWKEKVCKYLESIYLFVLALMSIVSGGLVINAFGKDKHSLFVRKEEKDAFFAFGSIMIITGIMYIFDLIVTLREREGQQQKEPTMESGQSL